MTKWRGAGDPAPRFVDSLADAAGYYASLKWDTPLKYNPQRAWQANCKPFLVILANVPHSMSALEDGVFVQFFTPDREDWLRGAAQYLRKELRKGDEHADVSDSV